MAVPAAFAARIPPKKIHLSSVEVELMRTTGQWPLQPLPERLFGGFVNFRHICSQARSLSIHRLVHPKSVDYTSPSFNSMESYANGGEAGCIHNAVFLCLCACTNTDARRIFPSRPGVRQSHPALSRSGINSTVVSRGNRARLEKRSSRGARGNGTVDCRHIRRQLFGGKPPVVSIGPHEQPGPCGKRHV